jgi:hypothetical protein
MTLERRAAIANSADGTASNQSPEEREQYLLFVLLDAHNLLNHGIRSAELHRLMRNLRSMVPVKTTPQSSCDGHNGNRSEKSFQTLHGLSLIFIVSAPHITRASNLVHGISIVDLNQQSEANYLAWCCINRTEAMSAFGQKADHRRSNFGCLLPTQSGHTRLHI